MQLRIKRFEQHQPLLSEYFREQFSERAAVGLPRVVTFLEKLRQQDAALPGQQIGGIVNQFFHRSAESDFPDRTSGVRSIRSRTLKTFQHAILEPAYVAHFFDIVIFRGHPEHRHGLHA